MLETPSCFAISGKFSGALLNFWVDVREITLRSATLASRVRISSCTPSAKKALSGSRLRLSNGKTAIDLLAISVTPDERSIVGWCQNRLKASKPAASNAMAPTKIANFFVLQCCSLAVASDESLSVRVKPCGVASNAQEIITEITKAQSRRTTKASTTQPAASTVA